MHINPFFKTKPEAWTMIDLVCEKTTNVGGMHKKTSKDEKVSNNL